MLHIAVFGSGRGSNFEAIVESIEHGTVTGAEIRLVVSNNAQAGILERARTHGIPAVHISRKQHPDDAGFASAMLDALHRHGVNFIVLAGYMKRVPAEVIGAYRDRIVNIHPALLPKFGGAGMYGRHVHEAVIAAGEHESGATVHLVDDGYDTGAIVLQRRVPVLHDDTPETLAERVLAVEHVLYPEAIRLFADHEPSV
jgi:formyltetrahydrofolate-dependent phosphoribosylglycinamide formyltransferase